MPCIRVKGGYKIRRSSGGTYPKVYDSLGACQTRVRQMHRHKGTSKKVKKKMKKAEFTRKVDTKMRNYGEIDYQKKQIRVNPKKRDLLNTIVHEEEHRKHPKKTEKQTKKRTAKVESKLTIKKAIKLLSKYDKKTKKGKGKKRKRKETKRRKGKRRSKNKNRQRNKVRKTFNRKRSIQRIRYTQTRSIR